MSNDTADIGELVAAAIRGALTGALADSYSVERLAYKLGLELEHAVTNALEDHVHTVDYAAPWTPEDDAREDANDALFAAIKTQCGQAAYDMAEAMQTASRGLTWGRYRADIVMMPRRRCILDVDDAETV